MQNIMLDLDHKFITHICGRDLQPKDVKAVLDVVKPYLTDEQIFQINEDAQKYFEAMTETILNNPENYGLV